MRVQKDWGVLISQTGSEVMSIGKETGFLPSLLITNSISKIPLETLETLVELGVTIKELPPRPTLQDYLLPELLEKRLITLHGFLRIIPESFFSVYTGKMYNGHPALITRYPELKGFNKQEDIAGNQEKYPLCGSVIHEVIPELDSGKVVIALEAENTARTIDEAYSLLRQTSLETWKLFVTRFWNFE